MSDHVKQMQEVHEVLGQEPVKPCPYCGPKRVGGGIMSHYITVPSGRVPLGEYVRSWKAVRSMPADAEVRGFSCWPMGASQVLGKLRAGMHDRINRHIPGYGVGRKWSEDWQRETLHSAVYLNSPRLVIDWLPLWLMGRFSHRLRSAMLALLVITLAGCGLRGWEPSPATCQTVWADGQETERDLICQIAAEAAMDSVAAARGGGE